jgi:hypothetical protein
MSKTPQTVWASNRLLERSSVRIQWEPTTLAETVCSLPQSLHANPEKVPKIRLGRLPSRFFLIHDSVTNLPLDATQSQLLTRISKQTSNEINQSCYYESCRLINRVMVALNKMFLVLPSQTTWEEGSGCLPHQQESLLGCATRKTGRAEVETGQSRCSSACHVSVLAILLKTTV